MALARSKLYEYWCLAHLDGDYDVLATKDESRGDAIQRPKATACLKMDAGYFYLYDGTVRVRFGDLLDVEQRLVHHSTTLRYA